MLLPEIQKPARGATLFRTGWFVGSTLTELALLLVLRTRRPALRSRPGRGLLISSIAIAAVTVSLPYVSVFTHPLALRPLPGKVLGSLALMTLAYVASAEVAKRSFYRAMAHPPRRPPEPRHPRRLCHAIREHGGAHRHAR